MGTFETLTEKTVHQSQNVAQAASVMPEEVKKVETPKTVVKKEQVTANAQTELLSVNPYVDTFKTKLNEKKFTFEQPKESTDETVDETVKDKILRIFHDQCIAIDQLHVDEPYVGLFLAAVGDDFLKQLQKAHDDHFPDMLTQDDVRDIQSKLLSLDDWASHKSRGYLQYKGNEKVYCNGFFKSIPERAVEYTTDLVTDGIESIKKTALALAAQAEKTLQDAGEKVPDMEKSVQEKLDALKKMLESKNASSDQIKKANDDLSAEVQKLNAELSKQPAQEKESSEKKGEQSEQEPDIWKMVQDEGWKAALVFGFIKIGGWLMNSDSWRTWGGGMVASLVSLFGIKKESKWATDGLKKCGIRAIPDTDGKLTFEYASPDTMIAKFKIENESDRKIIESFTLAELPNKDSKKDVPPAWVNADNNNKKIIYDTYFEKLQILQTEIMRSGASMVPDETTVAKALSKEPVQDALYAYFADTTQGAMASADTSGADKEKTAS